MELKKWYLLMEYLIILLFQWGIVRVRRRKYNSLKRLLHINIGSIHRKIVKRQRMLKRRRINPNIKYGTWEKEERAPRPVVKYLLLIFITILIYHLTGQFVPIIFGVWKSGWKYRKTKFVNGSTDGDLTNYQVLILRIHRSAGTDTDSGDMDSLQHIYCRNRVDRNFSSVIFTTDDEVTKMDFWRMQMVVGDYADFLVEIPSIPQSPAVTTFYIYYNPSPKTFTRPVGLYVNGEKQHCTHYSTNPKAKYFSGTHQRTYITFQDRNSNPYITYIDHSDGVPATPVRVATTPIQNDAHSGGALEIDANGRIHLFYGAHNSDLYWIRSVDPEDITSWETPKQLTDYDYTYPQVRIIGSTLWLFFRDGQPTVQPEFYRQSTNFADAWASASLDAATELINFDTDTGIYLNALPEVDGNDIHITYHYYDESNHRTICYAKWNDSASQWEKADGTAYTLPIILATADIVHDTPGVSAANEEVKVDENHIPYILYRYDGGGTCWDIRIAKWNGSSWDLNDVQLANSIMGLVIKVNSSTDIDIYTGINPNSQDTAIVRLHSDGDLSSWSTAQYLARYNLRNHANIREVIDAQPLVQLVWSKGCHNGGAAGYGFSHPVAWGTNLAHTDNDPDNALYLMDNCEKDASGVFVASQANGGDWPTTIRYEGDYSTIFYGKGAPVYNPIERSKPVARAKLDYYMYHNQNTGDAYIYFLKAEGGAMVILKFANDTHLYYFNGAAYIDTGYVCPVGAWEHMELYFDADANTVKLDIGGVEIEPDICYSNFIQLNGINPMNGHISRRYQFDRIILRQWTTNEPTWGETGEEEKRPPPGPETGSGILLRYMEFGP